MNYKYHIGLGLLLTTFTMFIINVIISVKLNVFAREIFNVYYQFNSIEFWIVTIPIILIYSILPDIDHHKSIVTSLSYTFGVVVILLGFMSDRTTDIIKYDAYGIIVYGVIIILATMFFSSYTKHRGPTHTIQFCIISTILLYVTGVEKIIYYSIAFISIWIHLWLDKVPFKVSFKPSNGHW